VARELAQRYDFVMLSNDATMLGQAAAGLLDAVGETDMHVLVLPEPTSFTAALKDTAVATLTAAGHTVDVSDLYAEGFDPVGGRDDFTTIADPERFHYQSEQEHAHTHNGFSARVAREQARFAAADMVVPVFPMWWGGMPAILKDSDAPGGALAGR
jgi:Putative NADPH-quinone reductase (modulator of drug activity B)